jgi:hypothetical protein
MYADIEAATSCEEWGIEASSQLVQEVAAS